MEFVVETLFFAHDAVTSLEILIDNDIDSGIRKNGNLFDVIVFDEGLVAEARELLCSDAEA